MSSTPEMKVDVSMEFDDAMSLDVEMDVDEELETTARPSNFPEFNSLPPILRHMIWKNAMDEERVARHVVLTDSIRVTRPVPALAHVCAESRSLVFQEGGVFELGDGGMTFFRPAIDFVYLDSAEFNLGELTSEVQNLIVPYSSFHQISETFENFFVADEPKQLKTIFIAMEVAAVNDNWSEMAISQLFGSRTIVAPALGQFDPLIEHIESTLPVLPGTVVQRWKQKTAIPPEESAKWDSCVGDVLSAWINTAAVFSNQISEDQFEDFEAGRLMHPDGGTWWDWFADQAPDIYPTVVFVKHVGDEIIETFET
ncbi:hypothetical protein F5Y00DRAFT_269872 [Daldinia vernicosa]|uniref:uncharacterized protein n=1 Tax=Daldinia vernicosa TaxID=114800 RepID=UPI002008C6A6|nr:uncharacterized protein F5Y00DRAFT_269872 [Daldinia vernicosa]KAI0848913.1 hypothetical protein F5Y00DRAFT_269872 [Daldinia vernicosa]